MKNLVYSKGSAILLFSKSITWTTTRQTSKTDRAKLIEQFHDDIFQKNKAVYAAAKSCLRKEIPQDGKVGNAISKLVSSRTMWMEWSHVLSTYHSFMVETQ